MSLFPSAEHADWWYVVSWQGLIGASILTAGAAAATVIFVIIQFWSDDIRDRRADERHRSLEVQTAQARAESDRAQLDSSRANVEAAKANERAAALEKEATSAKLELEKLRAQMAGRRLSKQQFDILVAEFTAMKDMAIDVDAIAPDAESVMFANDIQGALNQAGHPGKVKTRVSFGSKPNIGVKVEGTRVAAERLAAALNKAGLNVTQGTLKPEATLTTILVASKPPVN